MSEISNKPYQNSDQFAIDLANIANSTSWLSAEDDGRIVEIGLWGKICSILNNVFLGGKDKTSVASIDHALGEICKANAALIEKDSLAYNSICKIAAEAGLVKVSTSKESPEIKIQEKIKGVHEVASILRGLNESKEPFEQNPTRALSQKKITPFVTEQPKPQILVAEKKEGTANVAPKDVSPDVARTQQITTKTDNFPFEVGATLIEETPKLYEIQSPADFENVELEKESAVTTKEEKIVVINNNLKKAELPPNAVEIGEEPKREKILDNRSQDTGNHMIDIGLKIAGLAIITAGAFFAASYIPELNLLPRTSNKTDTNTSNFLSTDTNKTNPFWENHTVIPLLDDENKRNKMTDSISLELDETKTTIWENWGTKEVKKTIEGSAFQKESRVNEPTQTLFDATINSELVTLHFPSKYKIASYLKRHRPPTSQYLYEKKIIDAVATDFADRDLFKLGINMGVIQTLYDLDEKEELNLHEEELKAIHLHLVEALEDCVNDVKTKIPVSAETERLIQEEKVRLIQLENSFHHNKYCYDSKAAILKFLEDNPPLEESPEEQKITYATELKNKRDELDAFKSEVKLIGWKYRDAEREASGVVPKKSLEELMIIMNGGQLPHEYGKGYDLLDSAEAAREMADIVRDGHGLPENIDSLLTNLSESTTNEVMWETREYWKIEDVIYSIDEKQIADLELIKALINKGMFVNQVFDTSMATLDDILAVEIEGDHLANISESLAAKRWIKLLPLSIFLRSQDPAARAVLTTNEQILQKKLETLYVRFKQKEEELEKLPEKSPVKDKKIFYCRQAHGMFAELYLQTRDAKPKRRTQK